MFKPNAKVAIIKCQNCNYTRAIVANTKRRGKDRLLFNPKYLQDEDKK